MTVWHGALQEVGELRGFCACGARIVQNFFGFSGCPVCKPTHFPRGGTHDIGAGGSVCLTCFRPLALTSLAGTAGRWCTQDELLTGQMASMGRDGKINENGERVGSLYDG